MQNTSAPPTLPSHLHREPVWAPFAHKFQYFWSIKVSALWILRWTCYNTSSVPSLIYWIKSLIPVYMCIRVILFSSFENGLLRVLEVFHQDAHGFIWQGMVTRGHTSYKLLKPRHTSSWLIASWLPQVNPKWQSNFAIFLILIFLSTNLVFGFRFGSFTASTHQWRLGLRICFYGLTTWWTL